MGAILCHGHCPRSAMKHFVNKRLFGIPPSRWMYAREPASYVRLDRGREIGWSLEPDRPRTVVAHPGEQVVRDPTVELGRAQAQVVVPEEVLRGHRRVRLELADPDAVGPLQLEQAAGPAVDRLVEAGQLGGGGHLKQYLWRKGCSRCAEPPSGRCELRSPSSPATRCRSTYRPVPRRDETSRLRDAPSPASARRSRTARG